MPGKRHGAEEVISRLRGADARLGKAVAEAAGALGVNETAHDRWHAEYGGMKPRLTPERRRTGARPRVGIVGAGLMGRWHSHAARRVGARVVAVVDAQPERARRLARCCPGARPLTDPDALAEHGVEVVHVCTPLASHAPLVRTAIEGGLHALVEKPLTTSAGELQELYTAAAAAGTLLCPVHQVVFQRGVERAAAALKRLGTVCHIAFTICSAGGTGYSAAKLDEVVADILPHPLSLLRRLWPGVPLDAEAWRAEHPRRGEVLFSATHGGAILSVFISMTARPTRFELAVQCEYGTVQLDLFHGYAVVHPGGVSRLRKAGQPFVGSGRVLAAAALNLCGRALRREPAYPGLRTLVERFYDAVRGGGPPPVAPTDALAVACARDALIRRLDSVSAWPVLAGPAPR